MRFGVTEERRGEYQLYYGMGQYWQEVAVQTSPAAAAQYLGQNQHNTFGQSRE